MRILTASAVILILLTVLLALLSRGPVGPESIVAKDVQALIDDSAKSVSALARDPVSVAPREVPLTLELEVKRILKGLYSSEEERAEVYSIEFGKLGTPVRCFIRLRGDHVIGIAVEAAASRELMQALHTRFPGYTIHEIVPNPELERTPPAPLT
ncbi:hypothetical protein [Pseudoduganella sp. R-43]|uniref:hypothetical protein n=1 Tax=unclassified Pseudoduganella TaxID=2637179 RepID=UPI003CEED8CC